MGGSRQTDRILGQARQDLLIGAPEALQLSFHGPLVS
jgi:hypothetical protein